jgi:hypothetical protein
VMRMGRLGVRGLAMRVSTLVAPVTLLVALVYSQVGWRRDQQVYFELVERFKVMRLQAAFPSDGENLAASVMRVIRQSDTVSLAEIVRGRQSVIYFEGMGWQFCCVL